MHARLHKYKETTNKQTKISKIKNKQTNKQTKMANMEINGVIE